MSDDLMEAYKSKERQLALLSNIAEQRGRDLAASVLREQWLSTENERLRGIVDALCDEVPPADWQPWDDYNEPRGYGNLGDKAHLSSVDTSNGGDMHSHGVVVGMWRVANRFREAAKEKGQQR